MIDTYGIRWIGKIDCNGKLIEVGDIVGVGPIHRDLGFGMFEDTWFFTVWVKARRTFILLTDYDSSVGLGQPELSSNVMGRKRSELEVIGRCTCENWGEEDGRTTCWKHHDCNDGSCTHQE